MKKDEVRVLVDQLVACMKEERTKQGLSHETLAKRGGLTRQSIGVIESGQRIPSIISCLRIAKGLDVRLQDLLTTAEKRAKK